MAGVVAFMESPLVTWVKTFNASDEYVIDFEDFTDAVFLNDVLMQIDERDVGESSEIHRAAKDSNALIQNWMFLLKHIRTFYKDILHQTIVLEYPQVLSIVKEPTKDASLSAMEKVLLLLLGCAVQCQSKELYIHRIKELDLPTQQAIVRYIQKITEDRQHVVSSTEDESGVLQAVTQERDLYAQSVLQLSQERDYYKADVESKRGGSVLSPPPGLEQYHLIRQLAHANNSINTLTTDLEDKSRIIGELRDEVETLNKDLFRLKSQNLALSKDAQTGHAYRDEVDTYKEKALRVDALEREVTKLKEKLNEFDFYRARVEELRSDTSGLTEQRDMLEEKLKDLQRTHSLLMDDLLTSQQHLNSANTEKEDMHKRLEGLMEEHTSLQLELSRLQEGKFRPLISYASSESLTGSQLLLTGHPISEELNDCMSNGMTQLEMERDELQHDLEDTKQRLGNTQRELDSLKKTVSDSKKLLVAAMTQTDTLPDESERKVAEVRALLQRKHEETIRTLNTGFEQRIRQVKSDAQAEKKRQEENHIREVAGLKKDTSEMVCQIENYQESLQSEKDNYKRLEERLIVEKSNNLPKDTEKQVAEIQASLQRKQEETVQKLSVDFKQRIHKVESDFEAKKKSLTEEHDKVIAKYEEEKNQIAHQMESYKESWLSEKDNYKKLETLNRDLIAEKCQFKTTVKAIRKNSETCTKELEKELQALQIQADNAASLADTGECSVCRRENNQERVETVMAEIERQYPHLIYPPDQPAISRSRPSSGRFSHERDVPPDNVSRSMQSLPVQVSYVEGPPSNAATPQKREKSSSTMSVNNNGKADIMRPHSLRRGTRPASVMCIRGEQPKQRGRSSVTPDRLYSEPSPSQRFQRADKTRSTMLARNSNRPIPTMETFSRSDRKRMTLPEKRGGYVYHSSNSNSNSSTPKAESSSTSSHTLVSQDTLYLQQAFMSQHGTPVSSTTPSRIYHGTNLDQETHLTRVPQHRKERQSPNRYNSDRDSGFATSPNSPENGGDVAITDQLAKLKMYGGKTSEKLKGFVDRILELQDKNQQLTSENTDMKKKYNSVQFNEDRVSHIEKKNLELELENKKLRKIVESLQSQLSVGNPYDPREYHFYTNV